jgi:CubicO group peptidase (beta-lactamase class C family)
MRYHTRIIAGALAACLFLAPSLACFASAVTPAGQQRVAIEAAVRAYAEFHGITGGAIAILRGQQLLYRETFGEADIASGTAVDDETRFQLSSTSKLFTGTLMTMLARDGLVDFGTPIRDYLRGLPPSWSDVLLEDVMTHLSGLPEVLECGESADRDTALRCVFALERPAPRREAFRYNQTNYMLALMVAEKVTGARFAELLAERVLQPAGMSGTVWNGDSHDDLAHRATGYYPDEHGGVVVRDYEFPSFLMSAAGLNTTLSDMVAFAQALDGDELLDAEWKARMWRAPVTAGGATSLYAIGWDLRELRGTEFSAGHEGGSLTTFRTYPGAGLSVIVLINGTHEYFGLDAFADLLADTVEPGILPAGQSQAYTARLRYMQHGLDGLLGHLADDVCADGADAAPCDELLEWLAAELAEGGHTADAAALRGKRQRRRQ